MTDTSFDNLSSSPFNHDESRMISSDFSAAATLTRILRQRIINGQYKLGQRIVERELSQEFGISNGPIREALQSLVADGLAEREHFKGVKVIDLDQDMIVELFLVRMALLELAAEQAAIKFDESAMPNVERLREDMRAQVRALELGEKIEWVGGRMSTWLLDTADNRLLRQIWTKNMQIALAYVNSSVTKSPSTQSVEAAQRLIDCVCQRDARGAKRAVRAMTLGVLADIGVHMPALSAE